ncbi:MAG TPA: branched-chain amino acid ABC transporter permease [Anaeromyxobacteraceae bacterium]|nr:branched-chain amino acid ABC transporter permease [Anaeromyxobacteraceae bacterium]
MRRARLVLRSVAPFLVALPLLWLLQGASPPDVTIVLVSIAVNVVLAVSLNVVNGFTGQFSIGHAAFMAVGAYTAALLTTGLADVQILGLRADVSDQVIFFLALVAGMATASVAGLVVGIPSLRLRGDYLAIVTLGFGEIIRVVIENTRFLGQATGISGLPPYTNVVWAGMGVVATVVMARRLLLSTQGRALLAIREDEVAAEAMGVDTVGWKVRAFVISAAFAGLAGALLVHKIQLVTPRMFTFVKSMEVVVMVVLGGMGSISGSIIAATVLTVALEWLRGLDQYRMVIFSMLLIVLMLTRPSGLLGTRELWESVPRWLRRRQGGGAS